LVISHRDFRSLIQSSLILEGFISENTMMKAKCRGFQPRAAVLSYKNAKIGSTYSRIQNNLCLHFNKLLRPWKPW